ncbi:MAG: hypothetical protein AAGK04_06060 [Planctomycetota bacterium]
MTTIDATPLDPTHNAAPKRPDGDASADGSSRYGRARLWLGIGTVGLHVVIAALLLGSGSLDRLEQRWSGGWAGDIALLALVAGLYVVTQLPSDVLGGYLLPRRHGRRVPSASVFAARLARGVAVHAATWFVAACGLLIAGRLFGVPGVIGVSVALSALLLMARPPLARAMADLRVTCVDDAARRGDTAASDDIPRAWVETDDEAFTGGVLGALRPRRVWAPSLWRRALSSEQLALAWERRGLIARSAEWRRGRWVALAFTWLGVSLLAAWLGGERLDNAVGLVMLALGFTLWSFVGLLLLPTLSRAGVASVDRRWRARVGDDSAIDGVIRALDRLQDDEPVRASGVEAIFHPVPSVANRGASALVSRWPGCLDAARTSVFLGLAGLGFLGRAVHCNCGRPALWVWLPSD